MIDEDRKLPAKWWVWVRLAAILITIWMAIGYFVLQHSFDTAAQLSATRSAQAAALAGVPLSPDERTYFGKPAAVPPLGSGNRSDQIVAIGSLAAWESGMRATASPAWSP